MIRILLDGIEYEDVTGLEKAKLNIVRDESVKGLLIKFIDDVTFYGAAYDAILDYANTNGDCSRMPVDVYFGDEDGDGVQFSGFLSYKDPETKINKTTRHLTTKIQQGDLSNFIIDKLDYVFSINTDFCIDRTTSLTPITDRQADFMIGGAGNFGGGSYETYLVEDALNQCLEYISNGAVSLSTTVFDTKFTEEQYDIDFNGWSLGETMNITWVNYYGQTFETEVNFAASYQTSSDLMSYQLVHEVGSLAGLVNDTKNYFQRFSWSQPNTVGSGNDITVGTQLPFQSVSISVNPPRVMNQPSITKTQNFQWGLKDLAITRASILAGNEIQFRITLGQLLRHLNNTFNLSFYFDTTSTGTTLNLVFLEDLFTNTEAVDLSNMRQVDASFSDEFSINSLTTPDGLIDAIFTSDTWYTRVCIGNELDISSSGFSSHDFFNAFKTDVEVDDRLLYAILNDALTQNERYHFQNSFPTVPLIEDKYNYNAPYFSPFRVMNYFINSNQNFLQTIKSPEYQNFSQCINNCGSGEIENTNEILIDTSYTFEGYLTLEQHKTLISNNTQFIRFAIHDVAYSGFIKDISISLYTGLTTFELLAEDIKQ